LQDRQGFLWLGTLFGQFNACKFLINLLHFKKFR
jgi:hypothetical protein